MFPLNIETDGVANVPPNAAAQPTPKAIGCSGLLRSEVIGMRCTRCVVPTVRISTLGMPSYWLLRPQKNKREDSTKKRNKANDDDLSNDLPLREPAASHNRARSKQVQDDQCDKQTCKRQLQLHFCALTPFVSGPQRRTQL